MAVAAIFFLYVLSIRVYDIADTFLMLGEQTRDWAIALGGLTDLPLTGAPSTAGGRGFGPVYYWILWTGRNLIGPFTDFLPHAGGITVALVQSIADTWLMLVLWTRVGPFLSLAMCLTIASGPFDMAISSVIWNPPVAAALIKMATAMALSLGDAPSRVHIAVTAMLAWFAVQAHLSASFVAGPLLLALVVAGGRRIAWPGPASDEDRATWLRRWAIAAASRAAIVAGVVLILQIPYLIQVARDPAGPIGPTSALQSLASADAFRFDRSYNAAVNIAGEVLFRRAEPWQFQIPAAVAGVIVVFRWRRDLMVLATSIGGILGATLLFASWTRGYDSYWFLTLTPALILTFGMAVASIPHRPSVHVIGAMLLAWMVSLQPMRIEQATAFFKYPAYRTMRLASYELAAKHPVLRDIRLNFEGAHPTMDKYIMYTTLGGRIDPSAPHQAYVDADGSVRIE